MPISTLASCGDITCPSSHPYLSGCEVSGIGYSGLCVIPSGGGVHYQEGGSCDPSPLAGLATGSITCSRDPVASIPSCNVTGGQSHTNISECAAPMPTDATSAACSATSGWNGGWAVDENEVLRLVNQVRARGATCGQYGYYGPAGPLRMHAALLCSARLHSKAMSQTGNLSHYGVDGSAPTDRARRAGYMTSAPTVSENILRGSDSPQRAVDVWMGSPGHCKNIMNASRTELGVGRYGDYWTQNFGNP